MTNAAYSRLATKAAGMIESWGRTVVYKKTTTENADPIEGRVNKTVTEYSVTAVVFDVGGVAFYDGTAVNAGDRKMYLAGVVFVPEIGDTVTIGSTVHTVVAVKTTSPAGVDVLYEAVIRS